jgi:subtilisin family serine protease
LLQQRANVPQPIDVPDAECGQGAALTSASKEIDYKLNIDKINKKSTDYYNELKKTNKAQLIIAVVDTGINKEIKVLARIGGKSEVKNRHGTDVAYLLKQHCINADLLDVQISADKDATFTERNLADGLNAILAWEKETGKHVDVINISMGLEKQFTDEVRDAIAKLCTDHVIICAASNEGRRDSDTIMIPARLDGTIAVGAHTEFGRESEFSPVGSQLDFLCPGKFLFPAGKSEEEKTGTSYAAPIASAVAGHIILAARYFYRKTEDTCKYNCIIFRNKWGIDNFSENVNQHLYTCMHLKI